MAHSRSLGLTVGQWFAGQRAISSDHLRFLRKWRVAATTMVIRIRIPMTRRALRRPTSHGLELVCCEVGATVKDGDRH